MQEEIIALIKKIKSKNKKDTRFLVDLSEASGVKYWKIWQIIKKDRKMIEEEFFRIRAVIDDVKPTSKGCVIRKITEEDIKYIKKARKEGMNYLAIANSLPSGHKVSRTFVFDLLNQ